jgi:hypothetical protein
VPTDLKVLDSGAVYTDDGVLDYLWYHIEEGTGPAQRRYFKALCLNLLTYLPRETRETPHPPGEDAEGAPGIVQRSGRPGDPTGQPPRLRGCAGLRGPGP